MLDVTDTTWDVLPGVDLVRQGIDDLSRGRDSPEAALVCMARARVSELGFAVPVHSIQEPAGHHLYGLLATEHQPTAHSRYRALVRRLVSFVHAAEHATASRR